MSSIKGCLIYVAVDLLFLLALAYRHREGA